MTAVRYDLARRIVSFDFSSWLVLAVAKGATGVVFANRHSIKTSKWPKEIAEQRFESILWPMPEMLGVGKSLDDVAGEDVDFETDPSALITWVRQGNAIPRFKSMLPARQKRYTVTLRRDWRLPQHNSNEPAWRAFAAEIGAQVIEDFDVDQMPLHERFALYAGAEMNFGTVTGPTHMATLSEYPMMMFKANVLAGSFQKCGMAFGEQYPWVLPQHRLIWEDDTLDNIRKQFAKWKI